MNTTDFEKLGAFYLGREYDLAARQRGAAPVLYDSKDLVTHAVCVGMTGSGKTGLCLGLLEEAAIDGIPAIVIDPKGDLSNLLLTFPRLSAEDFRPWINEDDAREKGLDPAVFAQQQAGLWNMGLAEWGQSGERIQRLRDAAEFAIYTPGSSAGLPVSVLKSFAPPPAEVRDDTEIFRERIAGTVSGLLGLLGIESDPMTGREHILLSSVLSHAWSAGRELDLPGLIHAVQQPPFAKLGVMELESVFPAKDRFVLAMALNNLVAAPGFSAWTEGTPLDIGAFLFTPKGKPRVSIFSISHLSDAERMFFVSLLLSHVLSWTRTQSGTTSLRAIVYMDEIAGYVPPVANPPSKRPILTLMKQARAFGVGVVLATQNPVDLDYKGLANAGTWFIGRLQTDRDKQRVLDGLEGAAQTNGGAGVGFDRAAMDRMLSALGPRVFLMNNVHNGAPTVFETRWCMSYLRGPLTRLQIKALMDPVREAVSAMSVIEPSSLSAAAVVGATSPGPASASPTGVRVVASSSARPVLPPEIPQYFIPSRSADAVEYRPMVLGLARVYYADAKAGVDQEVPAALLAAVGGGPVPVDWEHAEAVDLGERDLSSEPHTGASFAGLPPEAAKAKAYEAWRKAFVDRLYRTHSLALLRSESMASTSKPGESERDFRARLVQAAREARDAEIESLRKKFAPKAAAIEERVRKAQQQVDVQKEQASAAKASSFLSLGTAVLGAFLGKKVVTSGNASRAATAARGVSRTMKEKSDVLRAEENVEALRAQLAELESQFHAEIDALSARFDPAGETLRPVTLKPKKTNITVRALLLAWAPYVDGRPAW